MKEAYTLSTTAASAALIALASMAAIMLVAWPACLKYEAEPAIVEAAQFQAPKKQADIERWPGRREAK